MGNIYFFGAKIAFEIHNKDLLQKLFAALYSNIVLYATCQFEENWNHIYSYGWKAFIITAVFGETAFICGCSDMSACDVSVVSDFQSGGPAW